MSCNICGREDAEKDGVLAWEADTEDFMYPFNLQYYRVWEYCYHPEIEPSFVANPEKYASATILGTDFITVVERKKLRLKKKQAVKDLIIALNKTIAELTNFRRKLKSGEEDGIKRQIGIE